MILYSASLSMFGAKVQIALIEKGIDYQLVMVPYDRDRGYEPRHPEVLRVNPKRQVPILIDGDVELFDSTQIFEYLEDARPAPPLWPREPAARAVARQLEHKSDEVSDHPFFATIRLCMSRDHRGLQPRHAERPSGASNWRPPTHRSFHSAGRRDRQQRS